MKKNSGQILSEAVLALSLFLIGLPVFLGLLYFFLSKHWNLYLSYQAMICYQWSLSDKCSEDWLKKSKLLPGSEIRNIQYSFREGRKTNLVAVTWEEVLFLPILSQRQNQYENSVSLPK